VGAPADVAIMELRQGSFDFDDNYKGRRTGTQKLVTTATVLGGRPI
jgi:dihydroorotase